MKKPSLKEKKEIKSWILQQRKDAKTVFEPSMMYDDEFDILNIRWLPQMDYDFSIDTGGIIFDISNKPEQEVIGIEIHNFKEGILDKKKLKKTKSRGTN